MHRRDLAIIALSCFAVYFSLQREGAFSFEPAWSFPLDDDTLSAGEVALPPPVVADLNGDGSREARAACARPRTPNLNGPLRCAASQVVVAMRDARLVVLEQPRLSDPGCASLHVVACGCNALTRRPSCSGFASARVLAQASLLPSRVRVASGRRAVALGVGHLDAHAVAVGNASAPLRKSVIAVVTAGWTVMCFDHNLRLLWEHALGADFPRGWVPREVAVVVTTVPLQPGDRGSVYVAASAARPDAGSREGGEDALEEEEAWERVMRGRRGGAGAEGAPVGAGVDGTHHVNYYAFEGRTGAVVWKHESADFHRDSETLADGLSPQHNYKLDAASLSSRHYGEVECREYREAVLAALPHSWAHAADTRLHLAHWAKHRAAAKRGAGGAAGAEHGSNAVAGALGRVAAAAGVVEGASGAATTQQLPRSALPNVLVAHLREGIEAVHLASGRTVCKLLLAPGGLHADVNADGVIDHVTAEGWRRHHAGGGGDRAPHCTAQVSSGVPARSQLFNGSVCRALGAGGRPSVRPAWDSGEPPNGVAIDMAPPAALPRPDPRRMALRRRDKLDAAFLNSRGEVSAFSPDGRRHFLVRTDATWTPQPDGGPPTLAPLLLRAGGHAAVLLAAGEHAVVVLSPSGATLATLPLPAPPAAPVQAADLSGDGLADLLVRTQGALYAYRQRQHPGALPFAFLLGALMLAMAAAAVMHAQTGGSRVRGTDAVETRRSSEQRWRDD
jgi:hypothetical protein